MATEEDALLQVEQEEQPATAGEQEPAASAAARPTEEGVEATSLLETTADAGAGADANAGAASPRSVAPGTTLHSAPTVPMLPPAGAAWGASAAGRPAPQDRPGRRNIDFKRLWLLTLVACLLLMLLSLGLLFYLLTILAARGEVTLPILPSITASSGSASSPAGSAIHITVFPQRFSPASCMVDNGYRCTAILMAGGPAGSVHWRAYAEGLSARFNPDAGTIAPGQQVQVIVYLPALCPASGRLIFAWESQQLAIPWQC